MPNRAAQEAMQADPTFLEALAGHTTDEMRRYEDMLHAHTETRRMIADHVELDKHQHQSMSRDIAEVKKTVADLAAGMALTTDKLTTAINNQVEIARGQSALIGELSSALLKTEDGKIDAYGHNQYHARSVIKAQRVARIKDGVLQGVILFVVVAVLGFVTNPIWSAFIKGPNQQQAQGQ